MDARTAGERVEVLLAELRARAGPQAGAAAEELVSCLVELYGTGLATIVGMLRDQPELLGKVAADPLVESLLLIHDLHPLDTHARVQRALIQVADVEYRGIDDTGVVHLSLTRKGCSVAAMRQSLEEAVTEAAPEITVVEIEEVTPPAPLLQIMRRPAGAR